MADAFTGILSALTGSGSVSDAASALGAASTVTVESQFTPPITFSVGSDGQTQQSGAGSTLPSWLNPLVWLKPKFTLTVGGAQLPAVAPWGNPDGNYVPHVAGLIAALAAGGLALWGAKKAAKTALIVGGGLIALGYIGNRSSGAS